ncbi:IS982 family transposase [Nonomuraea sp. NPDC050556]|uniref:IS982 family transposase n=1 Tax=Nonomuraea sp. NPDC050556 TaxID=3364369 RepID=UPI0037AB4A07
MDITTFVITVFCLIDDWLADQRLRSRGPAPTLADSEVLTIECVGEFLGIDTDVGLYQYFRRHWAAWFPALCRVHRTTFTRQAANLWATKQRLHQHLLDHVSYDPQISLIDSITIPICRFARAYRCRRLREVAAWSRDEVAKQTFLGLRGHLRVCWPGIIVDARLTAANIGDITMAPTLLADARGWVLADRAYGGAALTQQLREQGLHLLAPLLAKTATNRPPRWSVGKRRRIETVFGQLATRYHLKQVWARDAWHLWSRWLRKILSHTMAILLCQRAGLSPLRFAQLLTS